MSECEGGNSGSDPSLLALEGSDRSPSGISFRGTCEEGTSVMGGFNFRFRDIDCCDEDEFGEDEADCAVG